MTASQEGAKLPADSRPAFTYHGPPSGVTLGNGEEILLHTGATVHLVNDVPDGGRILAQQAVAVEPGDTPETLQRRVMEQAEWVLLPREVERLAASMMAQGAGR